MNIKIRKRELEKKQKKNRRQRWRERTEKNIKKPDEQIFNAYVKEGFRFERWKWREE